MKAFLIIILLFFIIIAIGVFVFVFTFDANQYKDLLVKRIEDSIDKDVKMGDLSLNILPGLALKVSELSIKNRSKTWGDALLNAESLNASIKLPPLIKQDIQLQHLSIKELKFNTRTPFALPVLRDVELKGAMKQGDIAIQRLTGAAMGGFFSIKGNIKDIFQAQHSELDIALKDVSVNEILPASRPDSPRFEANLSMDIECSARGFDAQKIVDSLSAKGSVRLDKAVLKNINVLNAALGKLNSILPGLTQRLKANLPERYSGLLSQDHTMFRPIETGFDVKDGRLSFQKAKIESDAFYMVASGYVSLKGAMEIRADLFIPQDLSGAFIYEVPELRYLKNSQGMITMPVTIVGSIPDISIRPDMDYLMKRLVAAAGEELLKGIFKKKTPQGAGDSAGEEKPEPEQEVIKTIFDIISGPKD